jgi:hypothetical protein
VLHVPATWQASLAVHVTALEPVQTPDWQESLRVHAFPSLQLVPFAAAGFEHTPVLVLHVPATWQASLAVHVTGLEPVQTPDWQESLFVQAFPSLQLVPFAAARFEHTPVLVLQDPATWHASLAAHVTGLEPVQTPDWQESSCVQAFPSLQLVPFGAVGFEQAPVLVLQVPATWHASLARQATGFEPVHTPDWQESLRVHAFPSLQLVPFAAVGFEHTPVLVLQVPATWHASLTAQTTGFDPTHAPA